MSEPHPLIEPSCALLSEVDQLLVCLAAHTASGDLEAVKKDWQCLPESSHQLGLEIILQTHLFAGYPRTINALAVVRKLGCTLNDSGDAPYEQWRRDGESLCAQIYAGAYDKLRDAIGTLHVDLESWMLEIGYGRVLSRPGPSAMQREFGVLAVLAGQNVKPQLLSHLRGALHVGATVEVLERVLDLVGKLWGTEAQSDGLQVLSKLR